MADIDFEAEGPARRPQGKGARRGGPPAGARRSGVSVEELRRAVEEDRLVLLPVERAFDRGADSYTGAEVAEASGLDPEFLGRLLQALGRRSRRR